MDIVLIIIGVLGFGAIVVSAYVFTVAARNYVSADEKHRRRETPRQPEKPYIERSGMDRRSGQLVQFPLALDGMLILEDRRRIPERRRSA